MATILQGLKVSSQQRKIERSPAQYCRDRLLNLISEQIDAANAAVSGQHFMPTTTRLMLNKFTGDKSRLEVPKRFRQCWWSGDDGNEPPRILRRLNTLRGLSHEEDKQVLA